jgi:hypothetical protein
MGSWDSERAISKSRDLGRRNTAMAHGMHGTTTYIAVQTRSAPSLVSSPSAAVSLPAPSSPPRCTALSSSVASTFTSSPSTPVTSVATRTFPPTFPRLSVSRRVTRLPSASAGLSARPYVETSPYWIWTPKNTNRTAGPLQRPPCASPHWQDRQVFPEVLSVSRSRQRIGESDRHGSGRRGLSLRERALPRTALVMQN